MARLDLRTLRNAGAAMVTATMLVAGTAHADPAFPGPGFHMSPAMADADSINSAKHLYVFGTPYRWVKPLVWRYNDFGRPPGISREEAIAGLTVAAQQWTNVCNVQIQRGPDTLSAPQNNAGDLVSPGENVIGWGDLSDEGNGTITGLTWTYGGASARINEIDMTLSPTRVDSLSQLTRTATHEWGHAIGLAHSNVSGAVMSGPSSNFNPGVPATSYNNVSTPTPDDKQGCLCLYGPSAQAAGSGYLCNLPTFKNMGNIIIGAQSTPQPVVLTNASTTSPVTINGISFSSPSYHTDGGCAPGTTLGPQQACQFGIVFAPTGNAGTRTAFVTIDATGFGPYSFPLSGTAISATTPFPALDKAALTFGSRAIGTTSGPSTVTLTNLGGSVVTITGFAMSGPNFTEFTRGGTCDVRTALGRGQSCTISHTFKPTGTGTRSAIIDIYTDNVVTPRLTLTGTGVTGGTAAVDVIEFYNPTLDHYFVTWIDAEIENLDAGNTPTRWTRTGYSFRAYTAPIGTSSQVCRYYIPPGKGDSHFFGRGGNECAATGQNNPTFVLEDPAFMQMFLPVAGACPANTTPVYRVFSNRPDANHRYMTVRGLRDQMVADGWLAEGDGPDLVVMCAPQ